MTDDTFKSISLNEHKENIKQAEKKNNQLILHSLEDKALETLAT